MSSDGDATVTRERIAPGAEAGAPEGGRRTAANSPWLLALVVEDQLPERTPVRKALRSRGVDSVWARTTLEAHLHLVRQAPQIDLIMVDLGMSHADMPGFCRSLRSERLMAGVPIVLMGFDPDGHDHEAFLLLELVIRVECPFDERGVVSAIESLRSQRLVRGTQDR